MGVGAHWASPGMHGRRCVVEAWGGGYCWGPCDAPQGACGFVCLACDRCLWADETTLLCALWSSVVVSAGPCLGAGVGPLRVSTNTRGFEPVHNDRGEGAR